MGLGRAALTVGLAVAAATGLGSTAWAAPADTSVSEGECFDGDGRVQREADGVGTCVGGTYDGTLVDDGVDRSSSSRYSDDDSSGRYGDDDSSGYGSSSRYDDDDSSGRYGDDDSSGYGSSSRYDDDSDDRYGDDDSRSSRYSGDDSSSPSTYRINDDFNGL